MKFLDEVIERTKNGEGAAKTRRERMLQEEVEKIKKGIFRAADRGHNRYSHVLRFVQDDIVSSIIQILQDEGLIVDKRVCNKHYAILDMTWPGR